MVRIMLVDDDDSLRIVYKELLELNGYEVVQTARNGEEAVNLVKRMNNKLDIIVMDHRMPIKSGIEATKEIKKFNKDIKIIFASADRSVKKLALSIGARSFLLKPFTCDRLISDIKKVKLK